jgi:hypothetical protein
MYMPRAVTTRGAPSRYLVYTRSSAAHGGKQIYRGCGPVVAGSVGVVGGLTGGAGHDGDSRLQQRVRLDINQTEVDQHEQEHK